MIAFYQLHLVDLMLQGYTIWTWLNTNCIKLAIRLVELNATADIFISFGGKIKYFWFTCTSNIQKKVECDLMFLWETAGVINWDRRGSMFEAFHKFASPEMWVLRVLILFMSLIPPCVFWKGCTLLFILTCSHLLKGIIFLAQEKCSLFTAIISSNRQEPSFFLLNLLHIWVLIIDSLLYRQQNATKITKRCSIDGIKPLLRFDRLSHLIISLKHWGREERGGEYALDSVTSKGVSVLNMFKALSLENIILYFSCCWKC